MEGSIPPTVYNVVKDQEYCGEIRVGLTFTPQQGFKPSQNLKVDMFGSPNTVGIANQSPTIAVTVHLPKHNNTSHGDALGR